jgi:hypothetical protein
VLASIVDLPVGIRSAGERLPVEDVVGEHSRRDSGVVVPTATNYRGVAA